MPNKIGKKWLSTVLTENKIFSFISADLIRARINFFFCYWFPKGRRWISSSGISCRDFTADQNALSPPTLFIFLPASNAPCAAAAAAAAGTRVSFFFFSHGISAPWNVLSGRSSRSTKRSRAWTNRRTMSAAFVSFAHPPPPTSGAAKTFYCASPTFTTFFSEIFTQFVLT